MKLIILLILIAVPLAEIAVFIMVGEIIGILPTVGLVILTAFIGVALVRRQGFAALSRAQQTLEAGGMPMDSVIEGVFLLIAGIFLLTPGLITDTAGFLLLVPSIRQAFGHWIAAKVKETGSVRVWTSGMGPRPTDGSRPGGRTIDGEYEDVTPDERKEPPKRISPRDEPSQSPWRK